MVGPFHLEWHALVCVRPSGNSGWYVPEAFRMMPVLSLVERNLDSVHNKVWRTLIAELDFDTDTFRPRVAIDIILSPERA